MYKLRLSRRDKKKVLRARWLILLGALVAIALIVWLAWVRPMQRESDIDSFDQCVAAGNPVQESYPEVCLTKDGKRFVNPKQDADHRAHQETEEELVPPTDPTLLNLDVDEWEVRIPLTPQTFDLMYAYIENGGDEYLVFTYKRLLRLGVCKGDIGLKLYRSITKRNPPYNDKNPAPIAQVGVNYFYATTEPGAKPCYDSTNADQMALLKEIAGEQSLIQGTISLLTKLAPMPE